MDISNWVYATFDDVVQYGSGTDLRVNCPFCLDDDTGHHLHISLIKEVCHCFRCDYKTSWARLVSDVEGVPISNAFATLRDVGHSIAPLYVLRRRQLQSDEALGVQTEMPEDFLTINDAFQGDKMSKRLAHMADDYLRVRLSRAVPDYWKRLYDVYGIFNSSRGYGRVIFPVEDGWWQARAIVKDFTGPKYMSPDIPKGEALYNSSALKYKTVHIAEGALSAECLGKTAVALCGKTATPKQVRRLVRSKAREFVLCLDDNTTSESLALAKTLYERGKGVTIRNYIDGDPADMVKYTEFRYNFAGLVMSAMAL
jgi:hypothetical protein